MKKTRKSWKVIGRELLAMTDEDDIRVCHECVGDAFLKEAVRTEGTVRKCSFCGKRRKSLAMQQFADPIHEIIQAHFVLTASEPDGIEYTLSKEFGWERSGEMVLYVIADIAKVEQEIAEAVREHLSDRFGYSAIREGEEDPYADEAQYEKKGPDDWNFREGWDFFKEEIRTRSRFFSKYARQPLDEIFGDVQTLQTWEGNPAVKEIKPEDEERYVYRVRTAHSEHDLERILKDPVKELGPPPSRKAKAGRMNAAGIAVFYGALDEDTCIAETRPPVGSYAVCGRFETIRPIRLLDFEVLMNVYESGGHFDPHYTTRSDRAAFLGRLVEEISAPVMPSDEEFEYLPTQAVAEYLAACVEPVLDGIVFHSSQTGGEGRNLVLFNHACAVEPYVVPEGTEISVNTGWQTDEDYDDRISIFEDVPARKEEKPPEKKKRSTSLIPFEQVYYEAPDGSGYEEAWVYAKPTLRLDVKNVKAFRIRAVKYEHVRRSVSRYRTEKKDDEP